MEQTRREIIRDLAVTDSVEVINAVKKTLNRIAKRNQSNQTQVWPLAGPQNLEEMKERIDRAQDQIKNGEGVTTNQFNAELNKEFPWL